MKYISVFLSILFLLACGNVAVDNTLSGEMLSVSLMLDSSRSRQKALVLLSHPQSEFIGPPQYIDSARIVVNNRPFLSVPSDSISADYRCFDNKVYIANCYNYYSDSLDFSSDSIFHFNFSYNGYTASAVSKMPGDFSISISGKKILWTKSPEAAVYRVTIKRLSGDYWEWGGTSSALSLSVDDKNFGKGKYRITVEAFGANFSDFFAGNKTTIGASDVHGVFGCVRVKEKVFIVE